MWKKQLRLVAVGWAAWAIGFAVCVVAAEGPTDNTQLQGTVEGSPQPKFLYLVSVTGKEGALKTVRTKAVVGPEGEFKAPLAGELMEIIPFPPAPCSMIQRLTLTIGSTTSTIEGDPANSSASPGVLASFSYRSDQAGVQWLPKIISPPDSGIFVIRRSSDSYYTPISVAPSDGGLGTKRHGGVVLRRMLCTAEP
jgi:hypothetical protein